MLYHEYPALTPTARRLCPDRLSDSELWGRERSDRHGRSKLERWESRSQGGVVRPQEERSFNRKVRSEVMTTLAIMMAGYYVKIRKSVYETEGRPI